MVRPLPNNVLEGAHQLLREGKSCRAVAAVLGVSKSVVIKLRKNIASTLPICASGRKKILSVEQERRIIRDLRQQKVETAVQIHKNLVQFDGLNLSVETVRNTLRSAGLRGRAKVKKPLLTKRHQKLRLDFARAHLNWTVEEWKMVIFSDETKINRMGSDGREWTWRKPGSALEARHVKPTLKFGGGSIMAWGCMMAGGVGTLQRIVGKMTSSHYVDILSTNLPATCQKFDVQSSDIVFQQDNDPKHTAKLTQKWLNDNGYKVMSWPPQSPDLNPIEHLWGELKRSVVGVPTSLNDLWTHVVKAWEEIPPSVCQNLVESMPRRIEAVITANGGYTKY